MTIFDKISEMPDSFRISFTLMIMFFSIEFTRMFWTMDDSNLRLNKNLDKLSAMIDRSFNKTDKFLSKNLRYIRNKGNKDGIK